jgi:hypothetical protein
MPPDRRQRLGALRFVWDPHGAPWEEGFRFLEIFRQREGHCRVPQSHREQGYRLGTWIGVQRQAHLLSAVSGSTRWASSGKCAEWR